MYTKISWRIKTRVQQVAGQAQLIVDINIHKLWVWVEIVYIDVHFFEWCEKIV